MSFPYSHDEIVDASERLYQALSVADLLRGLNHDSEGIDNMRLNDLGDLLVRLVDRPLAVLNELRSQTEGGDPEPGRRESVVVSITDKQVDIGGTK